MPEISRFYGIIIKMFFDDHNPPHFHALYGSYEVLIDLNTFAVFAGHRGMSRLIKLTPYRNFKNPIKPPNSPDRGGL